MSEEIHVNSRLYECCRAWCDSASEAFLASIGANRTIWLTPVDSLQKQEGRHRFLSCYLAISMNIKTAKNSEKQRSAPLFFAGRACPQARISAENEATLAVNFWEEQRKQRRSRSRYFMSKQCSGPRKRRARTSAAYSAAAAISSGQSTGLRFRRTHADSVGGCRRRFCRGAVAYVRSARSAADAIILRGQPG